MTQHSTLNTDMIMSNPPVSIVILAAGLGTRMKSDRAKVLHEIAGKSMLSYVLDAALEVTAGEHVVVVVGCQAEAVRAEAAKKGGMRFAFQERQLGTGHAVQCALDTLSEETGDVVILCGDVPFIASDTICRLVAAHRQEERDVTLLSVVLENPTGYGRVIRDLEGNVSRIIEEADASEEERRINVVNAGIYCVKKDFLAWALSRIEPHNVQNEIYLTDIIGVAYTDNRRIGTLICTDADEVIGVNSRADLARAEERMVAGLRGKTS